MELVGFITDEECAVSEKANSIVYSRIISSLSFSKHRSVDHPDILAVLEE